MIVVADQDQRIAFLGKLHRFHMHLGDQRAGGVDHAQAAPGAVLADLGRNSVGAVDHALAVGNFVLAVDEDRALAAQFVHHKAVVDDLFAHVDRGPERLQRDADDIDGPHHSGAKAPRLEQKYGLSLAVWQA